MTEKPAEHDIPLLPAAQHRVLIVDDEISILFAYRKLIEADGFDVDTSESILEAMDLIRTRPYLAIISDMRFEGTDNEDGIELLHFIREKQPDARVIIATGYGSDELKQSTRILGAEHFFEKPVLPSAILSALKALSIAKLKVHRIDCLKPGNHLIH